MNATQGQTRTFRILVCLAYRYTSTQGDPLVKTSKTLSTLTTKLSFLTDASITGDPSPF